MRSGYSKTRWLGALLLGLTLAACALGAPPRPAGSTAPPSTPPTRAAVAFPMEPPPPLPATRIEFPPFEETALPNGLRLILVPHRAQPLVSVNLYVGAGSAADPVGRAGLADMTADLLTKGTPTRTATQISQEIEQVGGTLAASAGPDWITLSANVLAEHLPLALERVSESARQPTFPADELELTRRRTLSALQSALGQPAQIAQRTFDREVYGAAHPYGINAIPGSVQPVSRAEIQEFHRQAFTARNSLLVVAGDFDRGQIENLVRQHFGEWEAGQPFELTFPTPRAIERTEIQLVHRPGSAQTNILIGHLGIRPDNPDFPALQVLNGVVGGHPDARLYQILREQRGWTYGSYSAFTRPRDIGYFMAMAEVRPEVTDSAVAEMLTQLRRIREESVPQDELEATKSYLAGSFPLRIETAGQIAGQVAATRLLGLPVENLRRYRERILAVTAEDVHRVAQQYVRPAQAVAVVVGDARELLPKLQAIAPVRVYDVEGQELDPAQL